MAKGVDDIRNLSSFPAIEHADIENAALELIDVRRMLR
jgi:hypothetical protein